MAHGDSQKGSKGIERSLLTIPVAALKCGKDIRLREALKRSPGFSYTSRIVCDDFHLEPRREAGLEAEVSSKGPR